MAKAEPRLSRAEWLAAALAAMAARGVAGVSIEPLARKLGVTKGSFYWHFTDREALLSAALDYWEQAYTERIIDELSTLGDPRERLSHLIGQVSAGGQADRVHIALASDKHPRVRTALARVSKRRLDCLESCYAALGQNRDEARQNALLAYAAYVGLVHLRIEAPSALPSGDTLRAYIAHVVEKLVP